MLIVGAGGLAKEVLEIFHEKIMPGQLFFYDDVNADNKGLWYGQFSILKNMSEVKALFKNDNSFVVAVGQPSARKMLHEKFIVAGGKPVSAISSYATIGHYGTEVQAGTIVMAGTVITNDVKIGEGTLINPNCVISHDTTIGAFCEISPGVKITGACNIGESASIGTGAIILPKVKLGNHVTVGAGAVVTKDVAEGLTVVGIPAKPLLKN